MPLFVVGCGVKASLFTGHSGVEVGNCSVACVEDDIMERLPQMLCVGIGCCRINITVDLRAFTLNISRTTGHAARLREKVNAFITDQDGYWFTASDLEYTHLSGPAALSWAIPDQPNCKRAMDTASYACLSSLSKCQDAPSGGYFCRCREGSYGDPYIIDGCVPKEGQLFLHSFSAKLSLYRYFKAHLQTSHFFYLNYSFDTKVLLFGSLTNYKNLDSRL
ncbi:hypothetical protein BAE44_0001681 [Dichanthelium oligosanthes]|uniref:Wall-associated receptor kinase galacturonan-binding domain-containing protein n=1 Tax=Dichanthelium oligosanthes TaxID=888268 RepID=A0A1E5WJI9_9POAL|nr:hypothetical protein BAE44_0001681 [Dichanthelium oligosanthes]